MRKRRIISLIMALAMIFYLMLSMTVTASAFVSSDINVEATTEVIVEEPETAEVEELAEAVTPEPVAPEPLTPDGNGTIADDTASGSKQFITVQTKNGNYFYLILDRDREGENAYMLSQIDEADLEEFVEKEEPEMQSPIFEEPEITVPEPEPAPEPAKTVNAGNAIVTLLILAALGGGAFYYFKVLPDKKPRQPENLNEMEFDDDPEINEDEEPFMSEPFVEDDYSDDDP